MGPAALRLELRLKPDWETIATAWNVCAQHLAEHSLSEDVIYALCMSVQELLENAVKYGRFEGSRSEIELVVSCDPTTITIEVKNPVGADQAELRRFDETIQWIRGYQSPFEAYVEKLKQVSAQPFSPDKSGLGLTRVAYEGQCIIDFYLNEADELSVSAVFHR